MMPLAPLTAVVASLILACISLLRPPRRLRQITFAAGMVALALESWLVYRLLFDSMTPSDHAWWLAGLQVMAFITPIPWCFFVFLSGRAADAPVPSGWRRVRPDSTGSVWCSSRTRSSMPKRCSGSSATGWAPSTGRG